MGGKCEKILFIIRKTSESAYKDCLESITALKMPAGYIVKNAPYEILDVFSASDAYLDVCQAESPDISIILDDTVLPGRIIFADIVLMVSMASCPRGMTISMCIPILV